MKRPTAYAKRKATNAIREAVWERSSGCCERCRDQMADEAGELDHFFGRARAKQATENCWRLCSPCHFAKTNNKPSAGFWLQRFCEHCRMHLYMASEVAAINRWAAMETKAHFARLKSDYATGVEP